MEINCLLRKDSRNPQEVLADFLRTFAASLRYGKTVLFEGDIYYIPYYMFTYRVEDNGEEYIFLNSSLSEDIYVYKNTENALVVVERADAEPGHVLEGKKSDTQARDEVSRKIKLNARMRKLSTKYKLNETDIKMVYLPEQTFYVKGRTEGFFLVDGFSEKVDYKHLKQVEKKFASNYLKSRL